MHPFRAMRVTAEDCSLISLPPIDMAIFPCHSVGGTSVLTHAVEVATIKHNQTPCAPNPYFSGQWSTVLIKRPRPSKRLFYRLVLHFDLARNFIRFDFA